MRRQFPRICPACLRQFVATSRHSTQKFCSPACYHANHPPRGTPESRFWARVQKTDGCWLWRGAMSGRGAASGTGYGQMGVDGRLVTVSRFSYELHFGPIPEGMLVCHRCDNPPCVNPLHLFLGSMSVNWQDAVDKGRAAVGDQSPHSRLGSARVIEIRRLAAEGVRQKDLAIRFGIGQDQISRIVNRKRWRQLK